MQELKELSNKIFRLIYPHKNPIAVKREYGIPDVLNMKVRISPDGWFIVSSPDLPGLITQARDHQELIEMINDAVLTYFDVPRREADIVYNKVNIGNQVIEYRAKLQTQLV